MYGFINYLHTQALFDSDTNIRSAGDLLDLK